MRVKLNGKELFQVGIGGHTNYIYNFKRNCDSKISTLHGVLVGFGFVVLPGLYTTHL